jgi:tRNA 5-methylaminomethyl-2-thiouridine biosynthesis bifunctional protein
VNEGAAGFHQHQLQQRWAGQARCVVLQVGFRRGADFLAAWAAWRADAARCQRLIFVAAENQAPTRDTLRQAQRDTAPPELATQLQQAWPPNTRNIHSLQFDEGRVQLLLALGPTAQVLPSLRVQANAFWLTAEVLASRELTAVGRKAAPGASLWAPHLTAAQRAHLVTAGFVFGAHPQHAQFAPRHTAKLLPSAAVETTRAVVVGAGVAGAAVARALAQRGIEVTVLERHAEAAMEASGNAAALFHGAVHGLDGVYARLYRAAALHAQRVHAALIASGQVPGSATGLLRVADHADALPQMAALLRQQGLPADYVQALDAQAASALAGVGLERPAWHYPGGGWVAPRPWATTLLAHPNVRFVGAVAVHALRREDGQWALRDDRGQLLARAPLVVLANAATAANLLAPLGHSGWPLGFWRGQVTQWRVNNPTTLRMPVAGDGYGIPLHDGTLLCGATRELVGADDADTTPRQAEQQANLDRLQRLSGIAPHAGATLQGRVGWRLQSADSLPIAGAMPLPRFNASQRLDQARLLPREAGLFVLTALGSRGLTWAPLLAELVAAQALGEPWPLEQELADALDPARFAVRAARAATRPA